MKPQDVKDLFGIPKLEMMEMEKGYNGYPFMIQSNNISIMYNETGMEYHVMLTGQGCRFWETVTETNWHDLLGYLLHGVRSNFTRLDLAIDSFNGSFTIQTIRRKIELIEVVSKLKTVDDLKRIRLIDGTEIVNSLRFGSETSRFMIRMYDKKLERENADFEVSEGIERWVRTELQFRKQYANLAVEELYKSNFEVGNVVRGYLTNYIRFVNPTKNDSNKRRWKTSPFWQKFLDDAEKLSLSLEAPDKTMGRAKKWFNHQVGPTVAMFAEAEGRDAVHAYIDRV